jgi:FkbM family methyltransferase
MIRKITEIIDRPVRDFIYQIIKYIPLRLCVDVGAAAGHITRSIRLAGDSHTEVVAFEPFPGNHDFFFRSTQNLNNVKLVKKAVSDHIGIAEFIVPSVVKGIEPGWENYKGYSSLGHLATLNDVKNKSTDKTVVQNVEELKLRVDTTCIDDEFEGHVIDFMKIDVQGSEAKVLDGSRSMLSKNLIKILYIEWSGERDIIQKLEDNNYQIYDSLYVVGPTSRDIDPFTQIGFEFVEELKLSIGKFAFDLRLVSDNISPQDAIDAVRLKHLGWIQTDIIAVSNESIDIFLNAVNKYCQEKNKPA